MRQADIQIEVISELTGDSIELVREVIEMFRQMAPMAIKEMMDLQIASRDIEKVRCSWRSDPELITWYKEGLRHLTNIGVKGSV